MLLIISLLDFKPRVESHDVYEKTGTYAKKTQKDQKCILMITSWLSSQLRLKAREQGETKIEG